MNGLQAQFGDRIDFVLLDIDKSETLPLRQKFGLVQRANYALVAPDGETVVRRWFGLLDEQELASYLSNYLASLP
ncbi:MAG: hypothetical protein NZ750_07465 [Anaerolineae bacterium]|nr:hypothetical protein [Anaerolineae bacterium]MDW8172186.1 hypothetical protein [Anaerolineae bacterium]